MAPYRDRPPEPASAHAEPPKRPQPLRWFWYPALLALGPLGWATLAMVARTPRTIARDQLAALPFPVRHDRDSATDATTWRVPLDHATITLRRAPDGVEAEQLARAAEAAAPGLAVRTIGTTITLAPRAVRANHMVFLADLMCTWGLELHARVGITGMAISWRPPTGPPPSI